MTILRMTMDVNEIIGELELEIMLAQKGGKADLIPGLERAIKLISEL